jgi:hypothetical protein
MGDLWNDSGLPSEELIDRKRLDHQANKRIKTFHIKLERSVKWPSHGRLNNSDLQLAVID